MTDIASFTIDVPQAKLDHIRDRVASYPWFDAPEGGTDDSWVHGMSTAVLKDVVAYWLDEYDWREAERTLNAFDQYTATIDGLDIHFLHVVGEAGGKKPLIVTHGWPGSVYEFWDSIEPLAFPSKHGGDPSDAFDLIIPSLPGYGFSGKPKTLLGPKSTAVLWDKLMRDVLGYNTYLAQGGDWGCMVTSFLGLNHGSHHGKGGCKGIHINMMGFRPTPATPNTDEEKNWLATFDANMQLEGSYFMQQATKPQTLSFGMMDSPVGQAAWILEKFKTWSDLKDGDLWSVYSKDQLLTNLMIYLVNDAFATSVRYYQSFLAEGGANLPDGVRCETPTGFADFPGERFLLAPPRSWCDRAYKLTYWSDMPRGGHFAAMEVPDLFVEDVRKWARGIG
ncbi:MAG: epoxide hydrolase family protein [Pseudomonadota bacterium]